mmetsp:Transcript_828/g.1991  ORF Transcript_828/g.1991 Transcript_828/m.1991 type:complete len:90 (-) Transcript_828:1002-1271(-)
MRSQLMTKVARIFVSGQIIHQCRIYLLVNKTRETSQETVTRNDTEEVSLLHAIADNVALESARASVGYEPHHFDFQGTGGQERSIFQQS